jgi:probable rRNA maturation factor
VLVNVIDQQSALNISIDQVQQVVHHVLHEEGQTCDEVSIYFVDTATICRLHEQFFQDPSTTDCISFPMDEEEDDEFPYRILGEVFVCPDTAIAYAKQHLGDFYEETTLYIVHGLLHLMGYDDVHENDCQLMRQAEARHMRELKKFNLQLNPPAN